MRDLPPGDPRIAVDSAPAAAHPLGMGRSDVRGKRAGRAAFGVVLIIGACVMVSRSIGRGPTHSLEILGATWALALVAYAAGRVIGRYGSLAYAQRFAHAGLVLPSIGLALVLPITLHVPFVLLLDAVTGLDSWVELSLRLTWPTHLALALLMAVRAVALVDGREPVGAWNIYAICVVVSCVPWVILFGLPPLLVAVTGLPMVGLMEALESIAERERGPDVPRARVV